MICFITSPFFIHQNVCTDLTYVWVPLQYFLIVREIHEGEESICSHFVTWMKHLFLCPNLAWKLAYKWSLNWLSKEKKDTSFHIMSQKDQKLKRKWTFDIPKLKFQNRLEQKTSKCFCFFRQLVLWKPNCHKNVQVFFQILNPVHNAQILASELVGGQSEMMVWQFCHTFVMLMWWYLGSHHIRGKYCWMSWNSIFLIFLYFF